MIINKASPKFVSYLSGEVNNQPQPTSAHFESAEVLTRKPESQQRIRDARISRNLPRAASLQRRSTQNEELSFRPPASFSRTQNAPAVSQKQRRDKIEQVERRLERYQRSAESRH